MRGCIAPSEFREYHRLAEDDLPGLKNETAVIEKEYGAAITKVLKNDGLGLTAGVGAITGENAEVGITLLLPDFFRLQKSRTDEFSALLKKPSSALTLTLLANSKDWDFLLLMTSRYDCRKSRCRVYDWCGRSSYRKWHFHHRSGYDVRDCVANLAVLGAP
jgi:hypothetical protein